MSTLYVDNLQPNLGSRVMAAGHVVQVVNSVISSASPATTVSTYSETGISGTITPQSASSKVLVIINIGGVFKNSGNTWVNFKWSRNGVDQGIFSDVTAYDGGSGENNVGSVSMTYLDTPSSTSPVTYAVQFSNNTPAGYAGFNRNGTNSYITLMEIAQ